MILARALAPVFAAVALVGCSPGADPARRVVLITADTLRLDHLLAEAGPVAMPRTRAVAERGAWFERSYAATSSTQPTHASLFTGRHPWQHGVTRNGLVLPEAEATLAERLRAAGFGTSAVVASFPLHPRFGFAQGFDRYDAEFAERIGGARWHGAPLEDRRFYSLARDVTDRAIAAIDAARDRHQFLWVHYFDPHDPYGDAAGGETVALPTLLDGARRGDPALAGGVALARTLYRRDVEVLDRALGRLLARLERDAARVETHVVFVADHGESLGEGGSLGHGQRLTPVEIRVPLFILSPDVAPGARPDVAGSVDVFPTLLALAGLPAEGSEGRDLRRPPAVASAAAAFGMRRSYPEPFPDWRTDGSRVVLRGPWFYAALGERLLTGDGERVLLEDDPARPAPPAEAARARPLFRAFARALAGAPAGAPLDDETREALRALGYVR